MHQIAEPSILYFGTPVVLISTLNGNGSPNLAPISSIFWLGWRCIIGISAFSKTTENLLRTREGVLNLPSVDQATPVNALALTTGSNPVPEGKQKKGYRYEPNKFELAGLTPVKAETVQAPRVLECPVQMEVVVEDVHSLAARQAEQRGRILTLELRVQRIHLEQSILMEGHPNRVDPDKWRPLIMSFQEFYGLGGKVHSSRLGTIPESEYRTPDIQRARTA
ncbi:flavin reductase family protein [Puia sp.]|jgi:flavin reductase (DIM6/NTAB) family NADH-FMN oxidoreductase RutF|uniref:flavin reductase family protein n=1 Tax=Puia sp. TaxID=2045100 RepID=UPI002F41C397